VAAGFRLLTSRLELLVIRVKSQIFVANGCLS
jgi:hypothetical protein